jgi:large subunit ribosomal protein L17
MGRLKMMRHTVTALCRHERIELNYHRADEVRPYAERLISEALRYGDKHKPTMDLANFWLQDKTLIPKLFKVLAVRYQDWPAGMPYTRMLRAPSQPPKGVIAGQGSMDERNSFQFNRAVLELRGNPYPPLPGPINYANPSLIHNVLLEEARKDYFMNQSKLAKKAEVETQALPEIDNAHVDNPADPDEESPKANQ